MDDLLNFMPAPVGGPPLPPRSNGANLLNILPGVRVPTARKTKDEIAANLTVYPSAKARLGILVLGSNGKKRAPTKAEFDALKTTVVGRRTMRALTINGNYANPIKNKSFGSGKKKMVSANAVCRVGAAKKRAPRRRRKTMNRCSALAPRRAIKRRPRRRKANYTCRSSAKHRFVKCPKPYSKRTAAQRRTITRFRRKRK